MKKMEEKTLMRKTVFYTIYIINSSASFFNRETEDYD